MVVGDVLVEKRRLNKTASVPMSRARRGSASTRLALAMCTYHGYGGGIPLVSFFFFKQKTAYEIFTRLEFRRVLFRSRAVRGPVAARASPHRPPPDAAAHAETADSLSMAFLVLLESLSRSSGRSSCCTGSSTTTTPRSRRSSSAARTTAGSSTSVGGATSTTDDRGSKPRASNATSSRGGSSPPPSWAI